MSNQATDANLDLERTVLQAVITNRDHRASMLAHLGPLHFYDLRHRALWSILQDLHQELPTFDLPLCTARLQEGGLMEAVGGWSYYFDGICSDQCWGAPANIRVYIRKLRELAHRRRQQEIGALLANGEAGDRTSALAAELVEPAWVEEDPDQSGADVLAGAAVDSWERVLALKASGQRFAGLDCGFESINERLNGLCAGQLTVLAARPKIGKSTLAIQMALQVAQVEKKAVGFISLEMSREQIGSRAACILADLDSRLQQRGQLNLEEQERYTEGTKTLARLPFHTWFKGREIDAICAHIRQEKHIAFWVVDHLHKIVGHGETDHERYGSSAGELANMALEINSPILLLAQLNRLCEDRSDKRPEIGDLRASGSIEEHAVNVLMIYRPGAYEILRERAAKKSPELLGKTLTQVLMICEATRFGVAGVDELRWIPDRGIFSNLAPFYR